MRGLNPGEPLWYDQQAIGSYMTTDANTSGGTLGGGILACPGDIDAAERSYAQNMWSVSGETNAIDTISSAGTRFDANVIRASQTLLLAEGWSIFASGGNFYARAHLGGRTFTPYQWFVDRTENGTAARNPNGESFLDYSRHDNVGEPNEARGSINFAFADGHAALYSDDDLVDRATTKSTYEVLWSPKDREVENP
jgi:prepilin-type processing-associated H-X9-DG protein